MLKVVIDTNTYISALLNPGKARQIVYHLQVDHFQIISAEELIDELSRVASRAKFAETIDKTDLFEELRKY